MKCEELNNAENNVGVDSVFPVHFKDEGYSERDLELRGKG